LSDPFVHRDAFVPRRKYSSVRAADSGYVSVGQVSIFKRFPVCFGVWRSWGECDPSCTRCSVGSDDIFRNAVEHGTAETRSRTPGIADGETLTVSVARLDDGFAIADDGPGIPADKRNDIFEFGYTTSDDGTGFGPSIGRQLIEVDDWTVELDTSHDGARFVVSGVECLAPDAIDEQRPSGSPTHGH
jgi:hypothetical protein